MKKTFLLLLFFLCVILPAKAQLYVGGGINYYTTQVTQPDSKVKYFSVLPEVGFSYSRFSLGLSLEYGSLKYSNNRYEDNTLLSITPYFRTRIVTIDQFSLFVDAVYSHNKYTYPKRQEKTYMVSLEPGISYNLTDRFSALFHIGVFGY